MPPLDLLFPNSAPSSSPATSSSQKAQLQNPLEVALEVSFSFSSKIEQDNTKLSILTGPQAQSLHHMEHLSEETIERGAAQNATTLFS